MICDICQDSIKSACKTVPVYNPVNTTDGRKINFVLSAIKGSGEEMTVCKKCTRHLLHEALLKVI